MTLAFRSVTADDIDVVADLWDRCGLGAGATVDRSEIRVRLRSDDGFFIVGELDGRPVASAMGCFDDHRGWVKRVAVEPALQGGGLGRSLVDELERRFVDAGITKLRLAVWDHNGDGLEFWRGLDYVELDDIHYFSKDLATADRPPPH